MNGKMLSISSLVLALASCENGMNATSFSSETSFAAQESGWKNERPAVSFFHQEKTWSRSVKPKGMENIRWTEEKEIVRLKDDAAAVAIEGLEDGDSIYLIRTNVSDVLIPAEYAQQVRSVQNISGFEKDMHLCDDLRRLYAVTEQAFSDPKRADPWETPDRKALPSGKT